ncbi:hypothetical protein E2320_022330, partial [Naja naja]
MEKQSQEIHWGKQERTLLNSPAADACDGFDEDSQQASWRTRNMPVMAVTLEDDLRPPATGTKALLNLREAAQKEKGQEVAQEEAEEEISQEEEEEEETRGGGGVFPGVRGLGGGAPQEEQEEAPQGQEGPRGASALDLGSRQLLQQSQQLPLQLLGTVTQRSQPGRGERASVPVAKTGDRRPGESATEEELESSVRTRGTARRRIRTRLQDSASSPTSPKDTACLEQTWSWFQLSGEQCEFPVGQRGKAEGLDSFGLPWIPAGQSLLYPIGRTFPALGGHPAAGWFSLPLPLTKSPG